MKMEFSKEQAMLLHQLVSKAQILGEASRMISGILDVIEASIAKEELPKEEKK